ncbi:hypothetical protein B9Z19DRAFT_758295 [Tuber borchii]|uniref:Secreted protein n=1 Tax=Tuber borchii TaxID=42251 RepID=A0A2T6ZXN0_TUBBO|nr:hypothetical protein B9Z19DRAFT_758295 [Tuber borchii]
MFLLSDLLLRSLCLSSSNCCCFPTVHTGTYSIAQNASPVIYNHLPTLALALLHYWLLVPSCHHFGVTRTFLPQPAGIVLLQLRPPSLTHSLTHHSSLIDHHPSFSLLLVRSRSIERFKK